MTISAKVIADSVGDVAPRLTTLQLRYPKFIHGEFMTHRVLSRNASSSRAIPVERLIADVVADPVYPSFWGKNQPGMQAAEECEELVHVGGLWFDMAGSLLPDDVDRMLAWDQARTNAIKMARAFAAAGYHKQIVNRLLEPFCHINVVVTATEWSNFFALRRHPAAQPEMRELADKMFEAMAASAPRRLGASEWHLPYATDGRTVHELLSMSMEPSDNTITQIKISVARCARVSYLTQEGLAPSVEEDLKLYGRLVGSVPLHASPCEHQATPDKRTDIHMGSDFDRIGWKKPKLQGNLVGWVQYRKTLQGERQ